MVGSILGNNHDSRSTQSPHAYLYHLFPNSLDSYPTYIPPPMWDLLETFLGSIFLYASISLSLNFSSLERNP